MPYTGIDFFKFFINWIFSRQVLKVDKIYMSVIELRFEINLGLG